MVAFLGFMAAITLVMWLVPNSPAARVLHASLVERPLAALADFQRHHLIYIAVIAGFGLAGGEVFALLGPEVVAAFAIDLSIYLDAVIITYALSAVAAARKGSGWLTHLIVRPIARLRPRGRRRTRRSTLPRKSANDDDPAPMVMAA